MNFIHLLLSQFFTVIFQFRLQIHFKIIKIFSFEAEMLLWFLKDQRVYLHNVLFLACFNWEFFSRCKDLWHHVIKPMYKIAFVIFRHLIALPEKANFRSQILERPSIGEYWNISGVPVLPENVTLMFFRTCLCYSEAYNTGTQKWSSIVQYSCTSIWDLKHPRTWAYGTFSSSWSLWRNLVHHRTRVVCLFPRTLDDCLPGLFWTEPRKTLVRNSTHSDQGLTQCLLVVKARLKPAYDKGFNI